MKWPVISFVFFLFLQLQCPKGASLADKSKNVGNEIVNEDVEEIKKKDDLLPTKHEEEKTTNDSKHESTFEDLKGLNLNSTLKAAEADNIHKVTQSQSMNFTSEDIDGDLHSKEMLLIDTLPKNETWKKTHQARNSLGQLADPTPSTATKLTNNGTLNEVLGNGLDLLQIPPIKPFLFSSILSNFSTGSLFRPPIFNWGSSNWLNPAVGFNITSQGQEYREPQSKSSTATESRAAAGVKDSIQSDLNTTAAAGSAAQSHQKQNGQSLAGGGQDGFKTSDNNGSLNTINLNASSIGNNWQTVQGGMGPSALLGSSDQYNQVGMEKKGVHAPSIAINRNTTANDRQTGQGGLNNIGFIDGDSQNYHQQNGTSLSNGSQAGIDANSSANANNWQIMQNGLDANISNNGTVQNYKEQFKPNNSGITAANQNSPLTANAPPIANQWQFMQGIKGNGFPGGAPQSYHQQTGPAADIQVEITGSNQNRPVTAINANTSATANYGPPTQSDINVHGSPGGSAHSTQQHLKPSMIAGSQVGISDTNQNRPTTAINANASAEVNHRPTNQSGFTMYGIPGGAAHSNLQSTPSMEAGSQVGISGPSQDRPATAIIANASATVSHIPTTQSGLTMNGSSLELSKTSHSLKPLTRITQLMKVVEVISNVTSENPVQNNIRGQSINAFNLTYRNTRPKDGRQSLDDLTKIAQLLKVIEVISNGTPEGVLHYGQVKYNQMEPTTYTLIAPYSTHMETMGNNRQNYGLNLNALAKLNNNLTLASNPSTENWNYSGIYGPNVDQKFILNQRGSSDLGSNHIGENRLTTNEDVTFNDNMVNKQQFLPIEYTSALADSNLQVDLTDHVVSDTNTQKNLVNTGSHHSVFTNPTSANKRRSLDTLVKTAKLLDTLGTLANIDNPERGFSMNSEFYAPNANENTKLELEGTILNNLKSNGGETISADHYKYKYNAQEVAYPYNIDQGPSFATHAAPAYDMNSSNMAQVRPSTTTNNQHQIERFISGFDNNSQYRPTTALYNDRQQGDNNPEAFGWGQYNEQEMQPTAAGYIPTDTLNNNQYRQNAGINTNIPLTANIYDRMNDYPKSDQYNDNKMGPLLGASSETELISNNLYRPESAMNTGTQIMENGYPSAQYVNNQYWPQEKWISKPAMKTNSPEFQSAFDTNSFGGPYEYNGQYIRPPSTEFNTVHAKNPDRPFDVNGPATLSSNPKIEGNYIMSGLQGTNQAKEDMRSSWNEENKEGLLNSFQSRPNSAINAQNSPAVNNYPTMQSDYKMNGFERPNQYGELQMRPFGNVENQREFVNDHQPSLNAGNAGASAMTKLPTIKDSYEMSGFGGPNRYDGQLEPYQGNHGEFANNYHPWPNTTLNAGTVSPLHDDHSMNSYERPFDYVEQKFNPSTEKGVQSKFVNSNQYQPYEGKDRGTTMNNPSSAQGGVSNLGFNGFGDNFQYRPNSEDISIGTVTNVHNNPTIQGGLQSNKLEDFNGYNDLQTGPSERGFENNNNRPFEGSNTNTNTQTTTNYNPTIQGEYINGGPGPDQNKQQFEMPEGNQNESVNNHYRPNADLNLHDTTINDYDGTNNNEQQLRASFADGTQNGHGYDQYKPNEGIGYSPITENKLPKAQDRVNNYGINQFNIPQLKPSLEIGIPYNQHSPETESNVGSPNTMNGLQEAQGEVNKHGYEGTNNYNQQQLRPSFADGAQNAYGYDQYRPVSSYYIDASNTMNDLQEAQGVASKHGYEGTNNYNQQQLRPSFADEAQNSYGYDQYRPVSSPNIDASNTMNGVQESRGNVNINDYEDINNYNQQQLRPSFADGAQNAYGYNQYRPVSSSNIDASNAMNGLQEAQGDASKHANEGTNNYNQHQFSPSFADGAQNAYGYNQYRPVSSSYIDASNTMNGLQEAQGDVNTNDYEDTNNYNQQPLRPSFADGAQNEYGYNQYRPVLSSNIDASNTMNSLQKARGDVNTNFYEDTNTYNQQQLGSTIADGTQNGHGYNLYKPNEGIGNSPITGNKLPMPHLKPSLETGTEIGIPYNQYSPVTPSNVGSPNTMNGLQKAQGGVNVNDDYNGNNEYDQQLMRPSTTQDGYRYNQYRPNAGFSGIVNNLQATYNGPSGNDHDDKKQYNQLQMRPSFGVGTQYGYDNNNQYAPNVALNTDSEAIVANTPTVKGAINTPGQVFSQQNRPSSLGGKGQTGKINNQYRPTTVANTNAATSVNNIPATQNDFNMKGIGGSKQYNDQQIYPTAAEEGRAKVVTNNQIKPSFDSNMKGNIRPEYSTILDPSDVTSASKDDNISHHSTQRSQAAVKTDDDKQKEGKRNEENSLQASGTTESKDHSGTNLNQAESVASSKNVPFVAINASGSKAMGNQLTNPALKTHVIGNQVHPQISASTNLNSPSLISEYQRNTDNKNSKLMHETNQNQTSEVMRNQLILPKPAALVMTGTKNVEKQSKTQKDNPSLSTLTRLEEVSTEKGQDKESSVHNNSSTSKESKPPGSSETRSKAEETSSPEESTKAAFSEILANTSSIVKKTIEETQSQQTAFSVKETTPNAKNENDSKVECVKTEPTRNGTVSHTTIGYCMMHGVEHDHEDHLDKAHARQLALEKLSNQDPLLQRPN